MGEEAENPTEEAAGVGRKLNPLGEKTVLLFESGNGGGNTFFLRRIEGVFLKNEQLSNNFFILGNCGLKTIDGIVVWSKQGADDFWPFFQLIQTGFNPFLDLLLLLGENPNLFPDTPPTVGKGEELLNFLGNDA